MKKTLLLFTLFIISSVGFAKARMQLQADTVFVYDTIVVYDFKRVPKKQTVTKNNESIKKQLQDSLAQNNKDLDSLNNNKKGKDIDSSFIEKRNFHLHSLGLNIADYMNIGLNIECLYHNIFASLGAGYNFNAQYPLVTELGLGYQINLSKRILFKPEINSVFYIPLSFNFGTSCYYHLKTGIQYLITPKLAISLEPSIYYSPKLNLNSQEQYSNIISYVSPIMPYKSIKKGDSQVNDFGIGLRMCVQYLF